MALLADVKKRVRALLISSPSGCSPKQLWQDYRQVIGEELPYSALGYRSLMAFIQDISDVVKVTLTRDNHTVIYAVADEKTRHISRMVSRQKHSRSAGHVQPPPARNPPPKTIPDAFNLQLKQLFLCYPNGLSLERFSEAFSHRFGYYLNFMPWGYSSLEQVLQDAPGAEITRDPLRGSAMVRGKRQIPPQESLNALETSPVKEKSISKALKPSPKDEANPQPKPPIPQPKPPIPEKLLQNIKELLQANPAGVWLSQFSSHYKDYFGEDLPVFTQGYSTHLHLLSSLSQHCTIERPHLGNGDWLVVSVGTIAKVAPNHGYTSSAYISDDLAATISRILATYPEGVPLRAFLTTYKEYTKEELQTKELGFNTLIQLLERVEGVKVMKPPDAGFMMVYGPRKRRKGKIQNHTGNVTRSDNCASSENEEPPRPPGSMASAYTRQAAPTSKMVGVYVTHVHTPSCLCVQLIGETTTRTLEFLLEDLSQFYNSHKGDAYMIKKPHIGQPCCTMFNNDGYWYRAEVASLPSRDITEVTYVDYGNTGRVPTTSLRRPKPHYMTLPAQAVRCRLAHLKPAGSTWSTQASQLLFQMTKDKPIVAVISSVKNGLMSASLCDTTTEEDIHINDTLVSQGLAIFARDTEEEKAKFDGYQPEPLPQGATGDYVPKVRIPSNEGDRSSTPVTATLALSSHLQTPAFILPTPPPTPAPHCLPSLSQPVPTGTPAVPRLQDPVAMQSYLINQQILLQQAFLTGLTTGLQPPSANPVSVPPGMAPLPASQTGQAGFNPALFAPTPNQTGPAVLPATPQPPQTGQSKPVQPVSQTTTTCPSDQSTPVRPTSVPPAKSEDRGREKVGKAEGEEREPVDITTLPWIKEVQLTDEHSLHVLRHNSRAYVLSQQVSEWFWDTDLLQSMLRQVQKPVWGLLLQDHRAMPLFREMKRLPHLRSLLYGCREVTVYALEDLPLIASTFHAPEALCRAVKRESERWLREKLQFFSDSSEQELERVAAELKELQVRRRQILTSLADNEEEEEEEEGEGGIQQGTQQLVEVTKSISRLKAVRARLLQQASKSREEATNPRQDPGSSSVAQSYSLNSAHSRPASSQVSDSDDTFYSFPSSQSSLTPYMASPAFTASSLLPTYTKSSASAAVPLSPFHSSASSSSVCSLSDLSHLLPLPPKSQPHVCGASEQASESQKPVHSAHSTFTVTGRVSVSPGIECQPTLTASGQYRDRASGFEVDGPITSGQPISSLEQQAKTMSSLSAGQGPVTTRLISEDGNSLHSGQSAAIRTPSSSYSSGQCGYRTGWGQSNNLGEQNSRPMSSEQHSRRPISSGQYNSRPISSRQHSSRSYMHNRKQGALEQRQNMPPRSGQPRNRSHAYRPSSYGATSYGSRRANSGQHGSRTAGSGPWHNNRPASSSAVSRQEDPADLISSSSSSGHCSPSEVLAPHITSSCVQSPRIDLNFSGEVWNDVSTIEEDGVCEEAELESRECLEAGVGVEEGDGERDSEAGVGVEEGDDERDSEAGVGVEERVEGASENVEKEAEVEEKAEEGKWEVGGGEGQSSGEERSPVSPAGNEAEEGESGNADVELTVQAVSDANATEDFAVAMVEQRDGEGKEEEEGKGEGEREKEELSEVASESLKAPEEGEGGCERETLQSVPNIPADEAAVPSIPPDEGSVPSIPPDEGSVPSIPPDEAAVPSIPPDEGSVPSIPPDEAAVPSIPPDEAAVPSIPPDEAAVPSIPPDEGSVVPSIPPDEGSVVPADKEAEAELSPIVPNTEEEADWGSVEEPLAESSPSRALEKEANFMPSMAWPNNMPTVTEVPTANTSSAESRDPPQNPLLPTAVSCSAPPSTTRPTPLLSSPLLSSPVQEPYIPSTVGRFPPRFIPRGADEHLVGWKDRRSIGLGRGCPSDNPRAFMFPGYPSCHSFPLQPVPMLSPSSIPPGPYYTGSWQFMAPHPQ